MSSSLAEQLQRLAVPQTAVLKRDKKRASLLYDPKEAAGLKRETFYQIGLEGLEELISKNEIFDQFRNTLFHITSKDFERSVQNEEANNKLDKVLKKFLALLSPYFLLNCSHRALEWLINRYSINEYNREDLLMLILPYHESNIFVRVLQLLKFEESRDSFYFLKALQKPGVHLPKQSLLNHAASNSGFLKFVTNYIMMLLKFHEKPNLLTVAFNFYCSVFAGALEYSEDIAEDQVTQMLPLLLKGLNSPIADFCAASYVITARLVAKTTITNNLLDKFVEKISEVKVSGLKTEACLVLLVIYQSQKEYSNIPPTAVTNLLEKEWLPEVLQELNKSGSFILPFLEKLVKKCTEEGINNDLELARDLVKNCLDHIKLEDSYVPIYLRCVLDSVKIKATYSEEATNWLTEIIQTLEKQYPNAFDKEVLHILSSTQNKKMLKKKKILSKILENTMTYKGKFDVFEKLYHPNPQFRGEAIKYLLQNYDLMRETDKEIIKNSFLDRLNDEDVSVVQGTLKIIKKASVLKEEDLKTVFITLANKCYKDRQAWADISKSILKMLCSKAYIGDWEVFLAVFPFLLPKSIEEMRFAIYLIPLPFISENELFKPHLNELKGSAEAEKFVKTVFKCLQGNNSWECIKDFLEVLKKIPNEKRDAHHKYVASLILTNILPKNSPIDICTLVLEILVTYFDTSITSSDEKGSVTDFIRVTIRNKFPTRGYLHCLKNVIKKTQKVSFNLALADFSDNTPNNKYFAILFNKLINNWKNELYKKFLEEVYLSHFCSDWLIEVDFLLNLCISENKHLESTFKEKALAFLLYRLKSWQDEYVKKLLYIDQPTNTFLVILLSDPKVEVRKATLDIVELLVDLSTRRSQTYYYLFEGLKKHKEEIIMDYEQMPLVMFNILAPANTKAKKHAADLNSIRNHLIKLVCNEATPFYLKAGVLKLLSHINTFNILEDTSEVALAILQQNPGVIEGFKATVVEKVISRVEEKVLGKINYDSNTWKLIEYTIKNNKTVIVNNEHDKMCPAALMLNQLQQEVFSVLDEPVVKTLLDMIVETSSIAQNPEVLPAASRIFKHIDLDADLILDLLIKMRDVQSSKQDLTKKKRRVSVVPTADILDTLEWKKGVSVLEFIQDKKKMRNANNLLPVLFEILKKCLDFDEQAAVEYPKQLILSLILHCCLKTAGEVLPENIFNMELIVQCIRASQNPQTHHHALLVLAHTAELIPTQVLHHMMAIFTFMGSSVLRHDDAYSFQIITKIVDTIIPILVKDNQVANIARVLRVFVDALLDVPEHRRMPLYKQLLDRINARENLYLFLLLIFESQVLHSSPEKLRKENNSKQLEIAANLCREFSPDTVIYSCIKLITYLNELPDEKEESMETDSDCGTFNIATHTPKDFRHYKYILLKFTAGLLASQEFVNQVAALNNEEEVMLEDLFKEMIINTLQYIQRISKVAEKASNTPQAQYWKVILHHSYDILDSLNALVTPQMFLLITKGLMVHSLSSIRRRILELLNNKLQYNSQFFSDCDNNEMYALIPPIITIIEGVSEQLELEQEIIVQTALLSLKLLVKILAPDAPEKFVQILEFITKLIKSGKAQNNVLASVVLCLAELCVNLRAHAIAGIADFMPAVTKVLKQQKFEESPSVLSRSILTTIEKIFESMPLFLSPYLEKLLVELSMLISKWDNPDDPKLQPFVNKLTSIKQKIGSVVPPRVLVPAIEQCYTTLIEKQSFSAVSALMDILAENLSNIKGPDINSNLPELTSFFLNALKFRADGNSALEEVNVVEGHIVQAFTVLILKLSESTFRPLYYKLYEWAVRSEVKSERLITFYSVSSGIANSLKGLFVLFAGHFLNNSAQILDACNEVKNDELYFKEKDKNILLLEYVLKTLNAVFLHDNQRFINKDRFDVLMQPLVDQLENTLGGIDGLLKRNVELLTPCLVNFCLATADDALWKQMNYQILLKMRHNVPKIRLAVLHSLTEIVKKIGEDFLPLLPETIPFLAELLEDEEEDVELACQKAVQEMEKVLGEPLQKYF